MNKYTAFGMVVESEFPVPQIMAAESLQADVRICRASLPDMPQGQGFLMDENCVRFLIPEVGKFRISKGNLIEVDPTPSYSESLLAVYLMGSCIGAVLHQRGLFPLHGSCVTNGKDSIILTGDSGAGKSTLAAEFLSRGWKLMTDDVAVVKEIDGVPVVQSSYPSQKLWKDSLEQYSPEPERVHSLYAEDERVKYGVSIADKFYAGTAPLTHIIRLLPADAESSIQPIEGMAKVDQLMYNTYRFYLITKEKRQRHFQRCVTLAQKVPMSLVIRNKNEQTAAKLYEMITETVYKHL